MADVNYMASAENFIRNLFKVYLEDRDFVQFAKLLHSEVSWIGTGRHEICLNYAHALELLEAEKASWDGHFKIVSQQYTICPINDETCLISGEVVAIEDGEDSFLLEMESRLSAVCKIENGGWKLFHVHYSVPNAAQQEDEYVHKNIVHDYNKKLEEKLKERTAMLKQKTNQLETITDNILGGVLICSNDDKFVVEFVSKGFETLTGYTLTDLKTNLNGEGANLIYKADLENMRQSITEQLKTGKSFSLEYRIVHKTGRPIWVLDKGILVNDNNGNQQQQSILTDITLQKEQQEKLRLSEKRYELAMQLSDIVMFEYNIITRQLILYERDAEMYNLSRVVENGAETLINQGIIHPDSVDEYREMYSKIHAGVPSAKCKIVAQDSFGMAHDYEITLHSVFDSNGMPLHAVGVRKNISQMVKLQKEKEYGKTLVSNKEFIFEANITNNVIMSFNDIWLNSLEADLSLPYSVIIHAAAERFIAKENRELFLKKTSPEFIKRKLDRGEQLIVFNYRLKHEFGNYLWYEGTINIIKDEQSGAICMRLYHSNINDRKMMEQKAVEEQRLYEAMVARATLAYEVNISQNLAIKGHEHWHDYFGITASSNYNEMVKAFSTLAIYAEDSNGFSTTFSQENVLSAYTRGERQLSCQYRKPNENGELRWANCTLHLYQDPDNDDIKGFAYVEDIDNQKRETLALRYSAEHDSMTDLLNKATAETTIDSFLSSCDPKTQKHAFFMIDIDYFKNINDVFGHLYGDEVLREIATLIKSLFREDDIIGRVGGDEFVVLMKNAASSDIVSARAQSICNKLSIKYSDGQKSSSISASVGITLYPSQGKTFEELFDKSDKLLYSAKKAGRNRYSF